MKTGTGGKFGRTGVIDYGVGNVGSIRNMLRRVGSLSDIISDPSELGQVDRAILPGIGHFGSGMKLLKEGGWIDSILSFASVRQRPFLGICLGMQLLARQSEEGACAGLGLIEADVLYFDTNKMQNALPVPHMGWGKVERKGPSRLLSGAAEGSKYYFVHSLHMQVDEADDSVAGITSYGYPFVSAVEKGNIFGVQFHPEKSHVFGMDLLNNFCQVPC
jgi:imidazole glycerol-phosphate synthase subunit HisH